MLRCENSSQDAKHGFAVLQFIRRRLDSGILGSADNWYFILRVQSGTKSSDASSIYPFKPPDDKFWNGETLFSYTDPTTVKVWFWSEKRKQGFFPDIANAAEHFCGQNAEGVLANAPADEEDKFLLTLEYGGQWLCD